MPRPSHPLRQQFEDALEAHIISHGTDFDRATLIGQYVDLGVSQASAYRWVEAVLSRGKSVAARPSANQRPAQPAAKRLPQQAAKESVAPVIAKALPPIPRVEDVARKGFVPVLELLRNCIQTAQDLMRHARAADGSVRNARLLQQGSEHLRRAAETAAKLNETVAAQRDMEKFHEAVMEEIGRESPEVQRRILIRLRAVCDEEESDA